MGVVMAFLLADAKTRQGILPADSTKDVVLQASLDTALALAETYCNRRFTYAAETASFYFPFGTTLQLNRYPIEQVTSVTPLNQVAYGSQNYKVVLGTGQIKSRGWLADDQIDVTYTGGYKVLPADLELALWMVFDAVWAAMPGGGGGGSVAAPGQSISSITIPDVGTIRYDNGGPASSGSATGGAGGLLPLSAASILNLYRLEVC
jgi:hypothetical protein